MSNDEFYQKIIDSIIQTEPSLLALIDRDDRIKGCYLTTRKNTSSLLGKGFKHVLHILLGAKRANDIYKVYSEVKLSHQRRELPKLQITNVQGLDEYIHVYCIPVEEEVLIYVKDITEMTLMEQEFYKTTEHYEIVNKELNEAMSKLDLYLMDVEQAHKKVSALYRITSAVQREGSPDELLSNLLKGITTEFGFEHVKILLVDHEKKILTVKASQGKAECRKIILLGKGIIGYAAQHREVVYVPNVHQDQRYIASIDGIVSELSIPLIVDNEVIGVLDVQTSEENAINKYDLNLLMNVASQIAITVAHVVYVAKVEHQAVTDGLTGLYNYRYFYNCIDQEYKRAVRYNRPLSLLMLDIDYFKNYNDTYGHVMGDLILKNIAKMIKNNVRDVDTVVRYGGEEFAVILPETFEKEAYDIAERIRAAVEKDKVQLEDGGNSVGVTVSIGVAGSGEAESYHQLIHFADEALYAAKNADRNCVRIYKK